MSAREEHKVSASWILTKIFTYTNEKKNGLSLIGRHMLLIYFQALVIIYETSIDVLISHCYQNNNCSCKCNDVLNDKQKHILDHYHVLFLTSWE